MEKYPRFNGVLMKPGIRVYCHDREDVCYDLEGTITAVFGEGRNWNFDVEFDGSQSTVANSSRRMSWYAVSPTHEETESEDARHFRATFSLRIFLCHASEDKPRIRELYTCLKEHGFKPWLDEIDLEPGVNWKSAIKEAVQNSHVILVCISSTSITKVGFVQKEIHYSLERALEMPEGTIFIIPTRLDECVMPDRLSQWQALDLFSNRGEEKLIKALRKRAKTLELFPGA